MEIITDGYKKQIGVKKETATKLINELVERAELANTLDKKIVPYKIKRLVVFGSYLSDKEKLGDIDIFYELGDSKWKNIDDQIKYFWNYRNVGLQCYDNARYITSIFLSNKKKSYSFHCIDELESFLKDDKNFKHKEIFNIDKN